MSFNLRNDLGFGGMTVKFFALDGKTGRRLLTFGRGEGDCDNKCGGVFAIYQDLSRSSGLFQRYV